jgi:hypothetical protein
MRQWIAERRRVLREQQCRLEEIDRRRQEMMREYMRCRIGYVRFKNSIKWIWDWTGITMDRIPKVVRSTT